MSRPTDNRPLDWMRNSTVEGLVALVVGAASGMGEACAKTFAANGGLVMAADIDPDGAARVADQIRSSGGQCRALGMDVASEADARMAVNETVAAYSRLDVLINVATMVRPSMLEDVDPQEWDDAFKVNVSGPLALARACLPYLRESEAAAIVHAGSLAGMHGYAGSGSYGPSKAALIALSRQMALEWAVDGIRVNVVVPGTIHTPGMEQSITPTAIETRKRSIPLGRLSMASEQADVAVFLASPAASFVTGQSFVVDGGFSQSLFPQPLGMSETLHERAARQATKTPSSD